MARPEIFAAGIANDARLTIFLALVPFNAGAAIVIAIDMIEMSVVRSFKSDCSDNAFELTGDRFGNKF